MNNKTVVCSYGKNDPIEQVFERLYAMYVSNFNENYCYCALIDLPDATIYRAAGDVEIEEKAQRLTRLLNKHSGNAFFCAVRQRRFGGSEGERKYICEEGETGALKALWRYSKGKSSVLFPVFGCVRLQDAEQIYFSGAENVNAEVSGKRRENASSFTDVIEPNGISALNGNLGDNDAVFAFAGEMQASGAAEYGRVFEGLYSASALDKLLSCEPIALKSACIRRVGMVSYPKNSFARLIEENFLV